ncbi:hypothetical protein DACRYDRAFT_14165 [Dacryopinax primogenitus]|uniref:Uncharacterized protein n=1 Tax=Dacryopinax primogenitus (strain DJM 731) TaxID=1858805 RepID=M5G4A9_DACPD|nr:uncharacterized protein DACRYDRAFT_14165 [Dacryopinax primogenitus]EJU05096.1 hypothetical protein DACRYDRAFT_14165 [Dacryopinax primogenitus]
MEPISPMLTSMPGMYLGTSYVHVHSSEHINSGSVSSQDLPDGSSTAKTNDKVEPPSAKPKYTDREEISLTALLASAACTTSLYVPKPRMIQKKSLKERIPEDREIVEQMTEEASVTIIETDYDDESATMMGSENGRDGEGDKISHDEVVRPSKGTGIPGEMTKANVETRKKRGPSWAMILRKSISGRYACSSSGVNEAECDIAR